MDTCNPMRHVFKETNYTFRKGIAVTCQCGNIKLRMFAYQDITRDNDPLILQEFEIKATTVAEDYGGSQTVGKPLQATTSNLTITVGTAKPIGWAEQK